MCPTNPKPYTSTCALPADHNPACVKFLFFFAAQTGRLYDFWRNYRAVHSTIVHFQLRNLVWATSSNDVYVMLDSCVNHWSCMTRQVTRVSTNPNEHTTSQQTLALASGIHLPRQSVNAQLLRQSLHDVPGQDSSMKTDHRPLSNPTWAWSLPA